MGRWGFILFVASLGIACFGAASKSRLQIAYLVAQGFGWKWGENIDPGQAATFSLVYTVAILLAGLLIFTGDRSAETHHLLDGSHRAVLARYRGTAADPDERSRVFGRQRNHWIANAAVLLVSVLACIVALVAIPLQIFGGS